MGLDNKIEFVSIARELLRALDSGATISSIAGRNPAFGWDEG